MDERPAQERYTSCGYTLRSKTEGIETKLRCIASELHRSYGKAPLYLRANTGVHMMEGLKGDGGGEMGDTCKTS